MHELSVTQNILDIALRHAGEAKKITDVYLVIGELSSIVDDSVQFYWDMIAEDTLAQGAQLHFRRIPAELLCLDCQTRYPVNGIDLACPQCHSAHVQVTAGSEFFVEAIDIESIFLESK